MNIFEHCTTSTAQGDIGEARAIYEFVKRGWVVSKPINDKAKYDLIVDDGESLKRVQVKTTKRRDYNTASGYAVNIQTRYSTTTQNRVSDRVESDYDLLFVLTELDESWLIPTESMGGTKTTIVVGTKKYAAFQL